MDCVSSHPSPIHLGTTKERDAGVMRMDAGTKVHVAGRVGRGETSRNAERGRGKLENAWRWKSFIG